jgi:hypothetical protein
MIKLFRKFHLTVALTFIILLAACQPDVLPPTSVPAVMGTAVSPTSSPTAPPIPTPTSEILPQTPVASTMSADVEGWYLYQNETHAYRMSYSPVAAITLYGDDCLRAELYESGFLLITAVSTTTLPVACQPPQSAAISQPEMIHLARGTVMAEKQDGPLYRVALPNGLQLDFGLLPDVDPDAIDSQAALAVIGDMLDSIRFTNDVVLAQVTPTSIPVGCLADVVAAVPPPGRLRIVYELDGQTWEWREETGTAVPLPPEPTPEAEVDGVLSPDGRFLASLRQPDENTFEIWISAADGSNPRQLIAISPDEVYERYPQATGVGLNFGWVNESLIRYRFEPTFDGIGEPPLQTIRVVDAENGCSWPILPPDVAWAIRFVNKGQQLIALTEDGVQMIDTVDGAVRFDVPLDVVVPFEQGITFTLDDSRLFVYTAAGIALINPADGAVNEIPLDYVPVGVGHYTILPPQYWLENGTQFYTVTTANEDWGSPKAAFTIWLVDKIVPAATPINTFIGFYMSVEMSPDRRWVAFWTQQMDNSRQLYLADVNTGEQFLYDEGRLLEFIGWSPDSTHFLYKPAESTQPILGHICAGARPLTGIVVTLNGNIQWVDDQRLLVLEGEPGGNQPLRLVTLDGQSSLIATLQGDYPAFRFYFKGE